MNMNKTKQFTEEEIPYETLADFGLIREMIEDLPIEVLNNITAGNITPVLPIKVRIDSEHGVTAKSRFALKRTNNGVKAIFMPVLEEAPIGQFTEEQQALLKEGKAIMATINKNGDDVMSFVQIDPFTNQVMSVPSPVIGRNLQALSDDVNLSGAEMNVIQNGDPLTIFVNDEEVTVGIDLLNSKTGIRVEDGDSQKWKDAAKREWDKFTFGVYGCWVADENGDMSYVPEDDYTEELWSELKKRGGMQQHR